MEIDPIHHQVIFCYFFYSVTSSMLFDSLIYTNIAYKYIPRMTNINIQIYYIYNHISLIDLCNY